MAKHTQTIRWQFAGELFECVWPFCGIGAQRVKGGLSFHFVQVLAYCTFDSSIDFFYISLIFRAGR